MPRVYPGSGRPAFGQTRWECLSLSGTEPGQIGYCLFGIDGARRGSQCMSADKQNFRAKRAGATMQEGLYKVEMHTVHGSRRGVIYVWDGKMMGGNSAFAFIGTYRDSENGEVLVDISSMRHNDDPTFQPLFKIDKITLSLTGRQRGTQYFFEGGTTQLPGIAFNSVMTPISEAAAAPVPPAGKGGIGNGLYSIHIRMLDGLDGGNTGVMVLHDGKIRGGDAFFDYIGSFTSSNGRWKGELVNHE